MKSLKIFLLLTLPLITESISSCNPCNCQAPDQAPFVNCSLDVYNMENDIGTISTYYDPVDTLAADQYGIYMIVNRKENICQRPSNHFSFVSSAYACSCVPSRSYFALAHVTDIQIITLNDFDVTHTAGSDVSEYFFAREHGELALSIPDFIAQMEQDQFSESGELPNGFIEFILTTPPASGTEHQFEVRLITANGDSIQSQTHPVILM